MAHCYNILKFSGFEILFLACWPGLSYVDSYSGNIRSCFSFHLPILRAYIMQSSNLESKLNDSFITVIDL